MRIGFTVPNAGPMTADGGMLRVARRADQLGFSTLWITDHVVLPRETESQYPYTATGRTPWGPDEPYFEVLASLAFLAGATERIRLGTSVLIVPYRNPVVTAKQLASIDVLSGGRLTVGIGVGWLAEEFAALQTPPFAERGAVTDEYVRLYKALWTEPDPSFAGTYYQLGNVGSNPKPLQQPHPPILVGGDGRAAFRRIARSADGWQPLGYSVEDLGQKLAQLREICRAEGRDYDELLISLRLGVRFDERGAEGRLPGEDPRQVVVGTPTQIVELCKRNQELGVQEISFHYRSKPDLAEALQTMERLAQEVMPALA